MPDVTVRGWRPSQLLFTNLRRSKRYDLSLLPATVEAVDENGFKVAGPLPARIIDLSRHGAALFLTRVMSDLYHICFSVQENREHLLVISFTPTDFDNLGIAESISVTGKGEAGDTDGNIGRISIKAYPVWFDSYDYEDLVAFKMGVEFLEPITRENMSLLRKAMKAQK